MGTTQRTKSNGFLALPAAQKSASSQQHRRRSQRRIWGQELAPLSPSTDICSPFDVRILRCNNRSTPGAGPSKATQKPRKNSKHPWSRPKRDGAGHPTSVAQIGVGGLCRPGEPAPTTHGGYGRNTTGGWVDDDPRVVPPRPRAYGGGGAGFGVQESALNSSGGARTARSRGVATQFARDISLVQPPSGGCKTRRKEPASLKVKPASSFNTCWLLHMRHRPLWVWG
jgi:hypothetical protein